MVQCLVKFSSLYADEHADKTFNFVMNRLSHDMVHFYSDMMQRLQNQGKLSKF